MKPTVIKFFRTDCPPCKAQSPWTKQIAEENPEVEWVGINAQENRVMATKFKVKSVPTLVFMKNGEEVNRIVGLSSKKEIEESVFLLLE